VSTPAAVPEAREPTTPEQMGTCDTALTVHRRGGHHLGCWNWKPLATPSPAGREPEDVDDLADAVRASMYADDRQTRKESEAGHAALDALLALVATLRAQAVAGAEDTETVTRFEVIDYRASASSNARSTVEYAVAVTLSYQDDGRTLKVFLNDRAPERAP
jgi:hypothetical protein